MNLEEKTCPVCGIYYAAPSSFFAARYEKRNSGSIGNDWYCPNGHHLVFTETKLDKLEKELSRARQQLAQKDDEIASERREKDAAIKTTRWLKKRAAAGVCPDCNRTFSNMARHMKTKHGPKCDAPKIRVVK